MEFENTSEMLDFLNASTEPDHYLSVSAASATVMVEKPRELAALKLRRGEEVDKTSRDYGFVGLT